MSVCRIAALTGMLSDQAIEMLAGAFAILFKKVEGKDAYQDNQASQSAGNSEKRHGWLTTHPR